MDFPRKEAPSLDTDEIKFQILDWYIPEADKSFKKYVHEFKQPYDDPAEPDEEKVPDEYNMIIYGATEEGNTVSLRIKGYQPYFYVKPPESWETYSNKAFTAEVSKLHNTIAEEKYKCVINRDGIYKEYRRKIVPYGYEKHLV